ncbi:hypothetical protein HYFRA_00003115 [Hymenoscyphus fraxineus]|uniref:Diaminopimelate epimerase-like protein n=1 Tax=Hymenoscyphus fraxineus TaxID=746836 RepID=A0A9N9KPV3_9HELO|nr:hypothetical protein HYFRA_00003115 [Hymenoscyphus fraxineus]
MKLSFTTVDVFTTTRYQGNPLSIIRVPSEYKSALTQSQKQAIAKEFNLSEIVFLHLPSPDSPPSKERNIDIFTSYAEVPFAGHPTVGTSFYLLETTGEDIEKLITKAGPISIARDGEGEVKAFIPQAFHIHAKTFKSPLTAEMEHPIVSIVKGMSFIYVELPSLSALEKVALGTENGNLVFNTYQGHPHLDEGWQVGLVGTMYFVDMGKEGGKWRYRTRMIASREDPGTGSASSGLAGLLALRKVVGGEGRESFAFTQGVEMGRQCEISVEVVLGGGEVKEVYLGGSAVVVMEGNLEV